LSKIYEVKVHVAPEDVEDALDSPLRFRSGDGTYFLGHEDLRLAQAQGYVLETMRTIEEREIPVRFFLPHDGAVNDPPPESARLAVLSRLLAERRASGEVHIRFLGRNRSVPPDGFVLDKASGERCYVWQVVPSEDLQSRPQLADRFHALRAHLAEPNRRVVLSLGCGGLKLFCHATLLRLLDTIGGSEHVDEIWGSSAGALVGLLYCYGLSPHAIEQTGYDLYSGRYNLELRPSRFQLVRNLLRDAFMPSEDHTSAGFVDCAAGLQRMLAHYCDAIDPVRPLYCTAFNVSTEQTEVLTPLEVPPHLEDFMRQTDARDAALASSSVPLLFIPRQVKTKAGTISYIDGSTTEGVPMYSVVRKWDADRAAGVEPRERLTILFVKLHGSEAGERPLRGRMSKLRLLQIIASAGIETLYQRDLELIGARQDVELLGLSLLDSGPDFFETSRIPEFMRLAKETFPEQLARLEDDLRSRS
jgi:predicted acylesterase/phospholipase RssA